MIFSYVILCRHILSTHVVSLSREDLKAAWKIWNHYRAMFGALFTIFVILNSIIVPSVVGISCKDESGVDVPTWSIMKLPKGTEYYYYDAYNGFTYSPYSLNDTVYGALPHTMSQLWWTDDIQYIIYNDEPPYQTVYNFTVAHSKAVWMWDNTTAIVITHSIPMFPQGPEEQPTYLGLLGNAWEYGQTLTCFRVSLDVLPIVLSIINETAPLIYEESYHTLVAQQSIKNDTQSLSQKSMAAQQCITYMIDDTYMMFMKPSTLQVDIWASCISPYMLSDARVKSWMYGTLDGPYCPPQYPFSTVDIEYVQFPGGQYISEYEDHSKWGILNSSIVCFGDLNRVTSQMVRAGTVYCWKDVELWTHLNSVIHETNAC